MANREKQFAVAILGFGTVGSGVAQILEGDCADLARKTGFAPRLKYILDVRDFSGHALAGRFVSDLELILADPEVTVVVEAIGGISPALEFNTRCLAAKKSVVTSNKELVAACGTELLQLAHDNGVSFLFEAAVGGATPIIGPMLNTLSAGPIDEIAGILNGTTNFILTRMRRDGASFGEALAIAQQLGYAETADPSDDVDGIDPKRKIAILASIAFGVHIPPEKVPAVGIRGVSAEDLLAAAAAGGTIKLIARAKRLTTGAVDIGVEPMFVPESSRMYSVDDVFNACWFNCRYAGDVVSYGRGAGKLPTGGAIVADLVEAARGSARPVLWRPYSENPLRFERQKSARYLVIGASGGEVVGPVDEAEQRALAAGGARCYKLLEDQQQPTGSEG